MVLTGSHISTFPGIEGISTDSPVSSVSQGTEQQNIFARYKEIKRKNEALKATTYSEFWE